MIRSWTQWLRGKSETSKPRRGTRGYRPDLECLENRWLPSNLVVTVNSAGDDPSGPTPSLVTLRDAINAVNNDTNDSAGSPDVINFQIAGTPAITLGGDLPAITNPVTIDGSTQAGVTINGNGFAMLTDNTTATVNNITFTAGTVMLGAGASLTVGTSSTLSVAGDLTVGDSTYLYNYGSLSVSGNFIDAGSLGVDNAPFSSGNTTFAASFTVDGSFTAGDDSFVQNNGTATFSVSQDFTLGDYGFVYNGNSSTDSATFTVGGNFSIGTSGFAINYGTSTLNVTGDFTLGEYGFVDNGDSSGDAATLSVGGNFSSGTYGSFFNYGNSTLSVTGDFTLGDYDDVYNGPFHSTDAATFTVGGNFGIGTRGLSRQLWQLHLQRGRQLHPGHRRLCVQRHLRFGRRDAPRGRQLEHRQLQCRPERFWLCLQYRYVNLDRAR